MIDLAVESFPAWKAIAWCFYPMAVLLIINLLLSSVNDDDDDDFGGGLGVRVQEPVLAPVPSGT